MRLLSFFNDIEHTLLGDDPEPDGGSWQNNRMVNLHAGLARLNLASGSANGPTKARGSILLQAYNLADGTFCLKASLHWEGSDSVVTKPVFAKPGVNWRMAAAEVAAIWMAGAPASMASPNQEDDDQDESERIAAAV